MTNYNKLAEFAAPEMVETVRGYIEDGKLPDGFLGALFIGAAYEMVLKADVNNLKHIRDWVSWLLNEAPPDCWGNSYNVYGWKGLNEYSRYSDGVRSSSASRIGS